MTNKLPWFTESSADRFNDIRDTSLAKLVREALLALIAHHVGDACTRLPDAEPPKTE
ncbi:MAG: hypothetical protein Q8K05_10730 [Polaromonas sp.]|uniref:hypothetical protein n=1 Tax=Polaromonas sp. TaxID=1869339 RepID=UPI002730A637|nr:hypothetical protein [Polaromonas sp.]MDP2256511.1 hypothetical protein [Polaromonas sp.]